MSEIPSFSRSLGGLGAATARATSKTPQDTLLDRTRRETLVQELKARYESGLYVVDSVELSAAVVADLLKK